MGRDVHAERDTDTGIAGAVLSRGGGRGALAGHSLTLSLGAFPPARRLRSWPGRDGGAPDVRADRLSGVVGERDVGGRGGSRGALPSCRGHHEGHGCGVAFLPGGRRDASRGRA